jgi:hypothetical protein
MTSIQLFVAYSLARGFGHQWANLQEEVAGMTQPRTFTGPISPEEIAQATYDPEDSMPGETCPAWGDDPRWEDLPDAFRAPGCVTHRTGRGRLAWTVRPDGRTMVAVFRPCRCAGCWSETANAGYPGPLSPPRHPGGRCVLRAWYTPGRVVVAAEEAGASVRHWVSLHEWCRKIGVRLSAPPRIQAYLIEEAALWGRRPECASGGEAGDAYTAWLAAWDAHQASARAIDREIEEDAAKRREPDHLDW